MDQERAAEGRCREERKKEARHENGGTTAWYDSDPFDASEVRLGEVEWLNCTQPTLLTSKKAMPKRASQRLTSEVNPAREPGTRRYSAARAGGSTPRDEMTPLPQGGAGAGREALHFKVQEAQTVCQIASKLGVPAQILVDLNIDTLPGLKITSRLRRQTWLVVPEPSSENGAKRRRELAASAQPWHPQYTGSGGKAGRQSDAQTLKELELVAAADELQLTSACRSERPTPLKQNQPQTPIFMEQSEEEQEELDIIADPFAKKLEEQANKRLAKLKRKLAVKHGHRGGGGGGDSWGSGEQQLQHLTGARKFRLLLSKGKDNKGAKRVRIAAERQAGKRISNPPNHLTSTQLRRPQHEAGKLVQKHNLPNSCEGGESDAGGGADKTEDDEGKKGEDFIQEAGRVLHLVKRNLKDNFGISTQSHNELIEWGDTITVLPLQNKIRDPTAALTRLQRKIARAAVLLERAHNCLDHEPHTLQQSVECMESLSLEVLRLVVLDVADCLPLHACSWQDEKWECWRDEVGKAQHAQVREYSTRHPLL
jgi:hypothetical protein